MEVERQQHKHQAVRKNNRYEMMIVAMQPQWWL
jgi:hypothetical protein